METTLPLALGVLSGRPFYRCAACSLVQFLNRAQCCRRCHRTLRIKVKLEEPVDDTPPLDEGASIDNLAMRLQILLRGSGWTQQTLAQRAGVARATFCRVLHRWQGVVPSLAWLEKLAAAFGTSVGYLIRPCNGNFYTEIRHEAAALTPAQLECVAWAVALLAKDPRQGREAVEGFLGGPVCKPTGRRPR